MTTYTCREGVSLRTTEQPTEIPAVDAAVTVCGTAAVVVEVRPFAAFVAYVEDSDGALHRVGQPAGAVVTVRFVGGSDAGKLCDTFASGGVWPR
jgi:hypothetical protein